ncbi:MAG: Fe(3+) ABC transporter substrate-binding protein [Sphingomonadales bacterium]
MDFRFRAFMAVTMFGLAVLAGPVIAEEVTTQEVNVYSYRQEVLIKPLLDAFTANTGIKVNLVSGKADALLERLKNEGINSPADLLFTSDVGRLIRAKQAGVLQPAASAALEASVPAQYRDPEGYWFGLSVRARIIFYAPDRVDPQDLSTYADLVDPKWKGRICIRSSSNIYNQSLLASVIAHDGEKAAQSWARGIVANMARKPQGGDRNQIQAVSAGECDIAVANTYYYGTMLASEPGSRQRRAAENVALFWPDQDDRGAHVNISGAGLTRSATNKENAIRLLEFLVSDDAQKIYAGEVYEYPVKPGVAAAGVVAAWGDFKADTLNLAALARHNAEAMRMFDRAGWR